MSDQEQLFNYLGIFQHKCGYFDQFIQFFAQTLSLIGAVGLTVGFVFLIIDHYSPSFKLLKIDPKIQKKSEIDWVAWRYSRESIHSTVRAIIEHELLSSGIPRQQIARGIKRNETPKIRIDNCYELFKKEERIKAYLTEINGSNCSESKCSFLIS